VKNKNRGKRFFCVLSAGLPEKPLGIVNHSAFSPQKAPFYVKAHQIRADTISGVFLNHKSAKNRFIRGSRENRRPCQQRYLI
jgi:hypothetical protein